MSEGWAAVNEGGARGLECVRGGGKAVSLLLNSPPKQSGGGCFLLLFTPSKTKKKKKKKKKREREIKIHHTISIKHLFFFSGTTFLPHSTPLGSQ